MKERERERERKSEMIFTTNRSVRTLNKHEEASPTKTKINVTFVHAASGAASGAASDTASDAGREAIHNQKKQIKTYNRMLIQRKQCNTICYLRPHTWKLSQRLCDFLGMLTAT